MNVRNILNKILPSLSFKRFHNLPMFRYPKGTTQIKLLKKKKTDEIYAVLPGVFGYLCLLYFEKTAVHI